MVHEEDESFNHEKKKDASETSLATLPRISNDLNDAIIDLEQEELHPVDVVVKPKAYLKVLFHALKHANPSHPPSTWKEVIGLLVGRLQHVDTPLEAMMVVDAIPVTHGSLVHAEFRDYARLAQKMLDIKPPRFLCGWYHSHPGHGIFMSDTDVQTQVRYQKMWSKAIAAVIDPVLVSDTSFGWKIFRLTPDFKKWDDLHVEYADSFTPQLITQLIELYAEVLEQEELISEVEA